MVFGCPLTAILEFHDRHPLEGYRRLTFMMLDEDIVAVSPTSVYRVLKAAGRLDRKWVTTSKKGTGFVQPLQPHQHWHIDVSYINVEGTFYYLTSILDGYSRAIIHRELRETMKEQEIEVILQKALEKHPGVKPRIISDNGPQFIARDFQQFIRLVGITHVRTSPFYPQSNGKLKRWHSSLKRECIRPACPGSLDEARRRITAFVAHFQHGPIAFRDRIHHPRRQAARPRTSHLSGTRSQARGGPAATSGRPPTGRTAHRGCGMTLCS